MHMHVVVCIVVRSMHVACHIIQLLLLLVSINYGPLEVITFFISKHIEWI